MRPTLRRALVLGSLLLVIGGGVTALGVTGGVEAWTFYFPSRRPFTDPPGAEHVTFRTSDGLTISAWFFPATDANATAPRFARTPPPTSWTPPPPAASGARPTILVAHGNAGCLPDHDDFCSFLADYGFNVLLFDYRGYGRSDLPRRGLRREDLVLDAKAATEYLMTRADVDHDRIALLGYSLGGTIGMAAATDDPRLRAVVTLSTFATWKQVASDHAGVLGRLLIADGLDAADTLAGLGDRPYLIVHGDNDDIVPFRHAALLEAAAREAGINVSRIDVPGATHLNMTDSPAIQHAIADFYLRALTPDQPPPEVPPATSDH